MSATRYAALLAVSALSSIALARGATINFDRGHLASPDAESRTHGHYKLMEMTRDTRTGTVSVERIQAWARHLDMSAVTESTPADFHVWLTNSDASVSTDFGQMQVNRHGNSRFLLDSRSGALPDGVTSITAYAGGTIEIRDAAGASVLSATIGTFGQ